MKDDIPVEQLLVEHRQDGAIGHYLWRPLCVSALNTPSAIASSNLFLRTLKDTIAGAPDAADLVLPKVDLSRLFPEPAVEFVRSKGGEVRFRESVKSLQDLGDFSSVILAVGPHQLKALMPGLDLDYTYQPIYTCYLQYPEQVSLPFPMLGLADGLVQWAFDRGALTGEKGRIACVISAQGDHQQLEQDELAERCHRELRQVLKDLPDPQWTRVIAEKRATITSVVGLKRPPIEVAGAILAGDYTDPDYPPTLEAAVRSGIRAASKIPK